MDRHTLSISLASAPNPIGRLFVVFSDVKQMLWNHFMRVIAGCRTLTPKWNTECMIMARVMFPLFICLLFVCYLFVSFVWRNIVYGHNQLLIPANTKFSSPLCISVFLCFQFHKVSNVSLVLLFILLSSNTICNFFKNIFDTVFSFSQFLKLCSILIMYMR